MTRCYLRSVPDREGVSAVMRQGRAMLIQTHLSVHRFQISNTDHIIDVNKGNNLFEYDQVTIICPNYDEFTKEEDTEKYIIYNVSWAKEMNVS